MVRFTHVLKTVPRSTSIHPQLDCIWFLLLSQIIPCLFFPFFNFLDCILSLILLTLTFVVPLVGYNMHRKNDPVVPSRDVDECKPDGTQDCSSAQQRIWPMTTAFATPNHNTCTIQYWWKEEAAFCLPYKCDWDSENNQKQVEYKAKYYQEHKAEKAEYSTIY